MDSKIMGEIRVSSNVIKIVPQIGEIYGITCPCL